MKSASLFRPLRASMTFNMSMNLASFSCPFSAPKTALFANFILASVGMTISA
ncbi:hypothetical protein D3C85_882950 [compost metagenome]